MLHDIGKMAIPDSILLKNGPLTADEWQEVRRHPQYAYELLSPIPYLSECLDIPRYHHERWDGTGYPYGMKGKEIPLAARLFAVIDVYDALTAARPYRPGWDPKLARDYMQQEAKQFDPEISASSADAGWGVMSSWGAGKRQPRRHAGVCTHTDQGTVYEQAGFPACFD
jgi:HD-GYP domain-containing protein (c-di-GMP phosphodiesterase class II)